MDNINLKDVIFLGISKQGVWHIKHESGEKQDGFINSNI